MKHKILLTLSILIASFYSPIYATDIYVYNSGNYTPITIVQNIRKISITSSGIDIETTTYETSHIALTDFSYFRFYPTPIPAGITSTKNESTTIDFDGKNISIQSDDKLKYIEFISSNGSTLAKFSPTTKTIKYSISSLPKGLFIVKAVGRDKTCTKKIIN